MIDHFSNDFSGSDDLRQFGSLESKKYIRSDRDETPFRLADESELDYINRIGYHLHPDTVSNDGLGEVIYKAGENLMQFLHNITRIFAN